MPLEENATCIECDDVLDDDNCDDNDYDEPSCIQCSIKFYRKEASRLFESYTFMRCELKRLEEKLKSI